MKLIVNLINCVILLMELVYFSFLEHRITYCHRYLQKLCEFRLKLLSMQLSLSNTFVKLHFII
jgi:hypothetical protein